jgi:hypothetical protein
MAVYTAEIRADRVYGTVLSFLEGAMSFYIPPNFNHLVIGKINKFSYGIIIFYMSFYVLQLQRVNPQLGRFSAALAACPAGPI